MMAPDAFAQWLSRAREPAGGPSYPVLQRGADLFTDLGCGGCHAVRGTTRHHRGRARQPLMQLLGILNGLTSEREYVQIVCIDLEPHRAGPREGWHVQSLLRHVTDASGDGPSAGLNTP